MARGRPKKSGNGAAQAAPAKANGNGATLGFEAQLFLAADKLRKNLEPSDYKHVALGLIFLKHISIAFEAKRAELLAEDAAATEDPDEYLADNIFWVPKEARWSHLQANARQPTIGKLMDDAMTAIEAANESLKGVLPKDYNRPALDPQTPAQRRLSIMAGAIDWVLTAQQEDAAKETTEEAKKRAHRRYADGVVALSKAFALAASSDEARGIREEVGFFQAIRAALIKSIATSGGKSMAEREMAIQQIVSRAVVSTEIVDIMKAAGLESPDISILSDDFLAEVQDMPKKNLAIEALKKLIAGEVQSRTRTNVTQSKLFSERLEASITRYHMNALTTAQVLEELIQLAKDIRAARMRGEETGLSNDEIAFYDALAENG
jgi:Domain of unknown function (DUF3387)/HsdM N-terminal domain